MRSALYAACLVLTATVPTAAALPDILRQDPGPAAQAAIKNLPRAGQEELFALYARYQELLARRRDEGWRAQLLTGDIIETPRQTPWPARQIEAAVAKRRAERVELESRLAAADFRQKAGLRRRLAEVAKELDSAERALSRPKGTCTDWSDAVWAELTAARPEHWSVADRRRGERPFHTAAWLCAAESSVPLCLAFDPWPRGQADVYEGESWDAGSWEGRIPADFFMHQLPAPRRGRTR